MPRRKIRPIAASEIGAYVYCARAWWYRRRGETPANMADLAAGRRGHMAHGRLVRRAWLLRAAGYTALAAAVVLLAVYGALALVGR